MGQFQTVGLTTEAMGQLTGDAAHLRELFADVNWQTDRARTVVDGASHAWRITSRHRSRTCSPWQGRTYRPHAQVQWHLPEPDQAALNLDFDISWQR